MTLRVLVTGAAGFVGTHLIQSLSSASPAPDILTPPFDVTDRAATRDTIERLKPDACIHLAAIAAIADAQSDPDRAWHVNLHGTLNVAAALAQSAPGATLIFVSSADAYGHSFKSGNALTESAPLAPMNVYGATKAAADLALGAMASGPLRIIRIRPFNHTGPGQSAAFVIPAFARQLARIAAGIQQPILNVGALAPLRDFVDVRDVCDAYVRCLRRAEHIPSGTIINLASGNPRRIATVLDDLLQIAGVSARIESDTARLRQSDIPVARGDATLAADLLGWQPRIPWPTTLQDVITDWTRRIHDDPPE
jgi:GDP-4-dehydro-6-deoxy-D-mannose reductase